MTSDLGTRLRAHYEEITPVVDIEALYSQLAAESPAAVPARIRRGVTVAFASAVAVLLAVGGALLMLRLNTTEPPPPVDDPVTTTSAPVTTTTPPAPSTTLPGQVTPGDPTPFAVRNLVAGGEGVKGFDIATVDSGHSALAYAEYVDGGVRITVASCGDAACRTVETTAVIAEPPRIESDPDLYWRPAAIDYLDLTLAPDGTPVVTYAAWDRTEVVEGTLIDETGQPVTDRWVIPTGTLHLVTCSDPVCSTSTSTEIDRAVRGFVPKGGAVAMDGAGNPVVAYGMRKAPFEPVGGEPLPGTLESPEIVLYRCRDRACSDGDRLVVDSLDMQDRFADVDGVAVHSDGSVTISLGANGLVICGRESCDSPILQPADFALESEMIVQADGSPVVAYVSGETYENNGEIRLAICRDPSCGDVTTVLLATGAGSPPHLALAPDGSPAVSWTTSNRVWLARCGDPTCSSSLVTGTALREAGGHQLMIGGDGLPVVAYYDGAGLSVAACSDSQCTPPPIVPVPRANLANWSSTIVDSGVGAFYPPITFNDEGHPVIAHFSGEPALRILQCGDATCATADAVDMPTIENGWYASVTIPADGIPVAVVPDYALADGDLSLRRCTDAVCSSVTVLDLGAETWIGGTVAHTGDGISIATYPDISEPGAPLMFASCNDAACSGVTDSVVDLTSGAWSRPRIAVDGRGLPVIAYAAGSEFRIARCNDPMCNATAITTFDNVGTGDDGPLRLAIGADGLPVVAYTDAAERVKLATCDDASCADMTVKTVAAPFDGWVVGAGIAANGGPLIAYMADGEARVAVCDTPACSAPRIMQLQGLPRRDDLEDEHPDGGAPAFSFAVAPDGTPVLAYLTNVVPVGPEDDVAGDLVVAMCTGGGCFAP